MAGGVPRDGLVLAALGPRVLRLAGDRTAGAIPYLVPPEHTAQARALLGPGPLLAPEHKVVLDTDPARARALGRSRVRTPYLGLVNYTSNLRRLGWAEEDLSGGGSDALIDALVAHGSPAEVAAQLARHLDAGADHVCIQLITEEGADPLPGYAAARAGAGPLMPRRVERPAHQPGAVLLAAGGRRVPVGLTVLVPGEPAPAVQVAHGAHHGGVRDGPLVP